MYKLWKFQHTIILTTLAMAGCGSENLSFKNADTLIESYSAIIKDMSEVDRQNFDRKMILIINDDKTPIEELALADWNQAISRGSELKYIAGDNPGKQDFASRLALQGIDSLDGKSATYVFSRGSEIKQAILDNEATSTRDELVILKEALANLTANKEAHRDAFEAAWQADKKLMETTPHKITSVLKTVSKGRSGYTSFSGDVSFENKTDKIADNIAIIHHVNYDGYQAIVWPNSAAIRNRVEPGATGKNRLRFTLTSKNFRSLEGKTKPSDFTLPNDTSQYEITSRPIVLRLKTDRRSRDGEVLRYAITPDQKQDLFEYDKRNKSCSAGIENIEKVISIYQARLEAFESDDLDSLTGSSVRYSESC